MLINSNRADVNWLDTQYPEFKEVLTKGLDSYKNPAVS